MPARPKWPGSPTPESCRTCGDPTAPAAERDAVDQSIGDDLQVRPLQCRTQIGARRALAPPPAAGLLNPADTVAGAGRQMVDVGVVFEPDLGSRLDQLPAQQRLVGGSRRQQRPALAVKFVGAALPILGLLEIGQHVVPRPAAITELSPVIEI